MSRDASFALLEAIRSALAADATIAAAVGAKITADWGVTLAAPFMRLSIPATTRFEDDCGDGSDYGLRVHVFTTDLEQHFALAAQVREALQDKDLPVIGAGLWWLDYDQTIRSQDPDDPTLRMAIVAFKAVTTS